jgi:TRAP-type C4-dicarboxylate transport system substrate-binding protein
LNIEEKKAVLSVVETFAKEAKHSTDFWTELSKDQRNAIDQAIKEADAGKLKTHQQIMRKLRK